jgi:LmbE family N-acetylglucosaminyl deacetylase
VLELGLTRNVTGGLRILCLGAHSDDIEIGCGGTVLKLLGESDSVSVYWVVLGASGEREEEARKSADVFLARAKERQVVINRFRDGFFPYVGYEIKEYFESLKGLVTPDVVFTHYRQDLHQDHRLVSDLTWNTFRNHLVLEYEIPKYDGDLGVPNFFVHLPRATASLKTQQLLRCFRTQAGRAWFTENTFLSLMRLRGVESNAPEEFAEAFHCRKIVCS